MIPLRVPLAELADIKDPPGLSYVIVCVCVCVCVCVYYVYIYIYIYIFIHIVRHIHTSCMYAIRYDHVCSCVVMHVVGMSA